MRIVKYAFAKALALFGTVVIGLYLTILVVNLGGYVDRIFEADVADTMNLTMKSGALGGMTFERIRDWLSTTRWTLEEEKGLHQPFMLRTWRWFKASLILDWGKGGTRDPSTGMSSSAVFTMLSQKAVPLRESTLKDYLLAYFPYTMLLVGVSILLLFLTSVPMALALSKGKNGKLLGGLMAVLSSASSAPSWIYGIILILIFVTLSDLLPYPRSLATLESQDGYAAALLKQMVLPVLSIFLSLLFQSVYTWRAFFLIYSEEDYVDLARAMGFRDEKIERDYILRPTLPYIITNFALMILGLWQSTIALEILFNWPGIGTIFAMAIGAFYTPLLLGVVVIFAYLLAITVFLLDFFYAWLDPRVRINFGASSAEATTRKKISFFRAQKRRMANFPPAVRRMPASENISPASIRAPLTNHIRKLWSRLGSVRILLRQPSGLVGLLIILVLAGIAFYTITALPIDQAVASWRATGPEGDWYANPRNALPAWVNYFRKDALPQTIRMDSRDDAVSRDVQASSVNTKKAVLTFSFDYPYDDFPQDLLLNLDSRYDKKPTLVAFAWLTPDGRQIELGSAVLSSPTTSIYLSQDEALQRKLGGGKIMNALFADPEARQAPLNGRYQLQVEEFLFEEESGLEVEFILYGKVYGLAGTDELRRDLTLPLLWGTPVALAFGLLGAVATTLASMFIAAVGVWFGGWVDNLIQRISEVNMILPTLAIVILVFLMYSNSIWAVLGALVLLNIFGSALKTYRAAFLQVKEAPYIEAARAQGASDWRIIGRYLTPRILPLTIPQLVTMVPVYVYYETTLAFLGVSDPFLPTWGKVIYDALANRAFMAYPHRILLPIGLLLVTGLGFALLGVALERVLNPRLRER